MMSDSHDQTVTIPSDTSRAAEVQEQIIAELEAHGYTPRDVFSMRLAIEEALVNAIKHGNQRDVSKQVHVAWSVDPDRVIVSVAVKAGEAVAVGQEVCALEAMKMKNAIRATRAGVIARVHVAPGQAVRHRDLLAEYA